MYCGYGVESRFFIARGGGLTPESRGTGDGGGPRVAPGEVRGRAESAIAPPGFLGLVSREASGDRAGLLGGAGVR